MFISVRRPQHRSPSHWPQTILPLPQLREYLIFFSTASSPPPSLLALPPAQVDFESQKKGDVFNNCLMTINGTDFRIPQQGSAMEGNLFGSHKNAVTPGSPPCSTSWVS